VRCPSRTAAARTSPSKLSRRRGTAPRTRPRPGASVADARFQRGSGCSRRRGRSNSLERPDRHLHRLAMRTPSSLQIARSISVRWSSVFSARSTLSRRARRSPRRAPRPARRAARFCRSRPPPQRRYRSSARACVRRRATRPRRITGSPHHRILSRRSEAPPLTSRAWSHWNAYPQSCGRRGRWRLTRSAGDVAAAVQHATFSARRQLSDRTRS